MKSKRRLILLKRLLPIVILIICIFLSLGYTTVNYITLDIGGNAVAMEQEGIIILDIKYKDGSAIHYANSNISVVKNSALKHEIALSSTSNSSYITYIITVLNNYDYDCEFKGAVFDNEFYDNPDIIFDLNDSIMPGDLVSAGDTIEFEVTFKYKPGVTVSTLNNVLNAYINYEFIPIAMLKPTTSSDTTMFRSSAYKEKIKTISIDTAINVPENAVDSWDIGVSETGDVMAYLVQNSSDATYYDLHIQSNTQLYANKNMENWFRGFKSVDYFYGINSVNTSKTTSMRNLFDSLGYNSTVFSMGDINWDTSKVFDMSYVFYNTGYKSTVMSLDITDWDTSSAGRMSGMFRDFGCNNTNFVLDVSRLNMSKVTDIQQMFLRTGSKSKVLTLDVSNWDVSNVTIMHYAFNSVGEKSEVFELDVSNWDVGKVYNMGGAFDGVGYSNPNFVLDVSNWDTSSVTDFGGTFQYAGHSNPNFTLDVSGFNTSKVTNFRQMFYHTGYNSTVFTLDVSNWNTEKATNMGYMFSGAGRKSSVFTLDVSGWNTSNVTDMSYMFQETGYGNSSFTLDVSNWDTSKVTNMYSMFYQTGYLSSVITLDLSKWDTSQVTNMGYMFHSFGFNNPTFTLDVSNFNTSNVTNMEWMFYDLGWKSTVCTLDVSGFDTTNVTNMYTMFDSTCYSSQVFSLDIDHFVTNNVTNMSYMFNNCGNKSPVFNVDVSGFDTSKVTNFSFMFRNTGVSSNVFRTTIAISNPNVTSYSSMFYNTAILAGSEILVKYTPETESIVDLMLTTKSVGANVIKWYSVNVGDVINIGTESFNVIKDDGYEVTLFAKYNLGTDYRQTASANAMEFASAAGWEYTPGPKEIDIQVWSPNASTYVNAYVDYLKGVTGDSVLSGNLITLTELRNLGCNIDALYAFNSNARTCLVSPHASWIVNGQAYWTRSASSLYYNSVWQIWADGYTYDALGGVNGIRPVIIIQKSKLSKYI